MVMRDRLVAFVPSAIALPLVAFLGKCLNIAAADRIGRDRVRDPSWRAAHPVLHRLLIGYPVRVFWGPAREELLFRAPVVLLCPALGVRAAVIIAVSALVFAFWWHRDDPRLTVEEAASLQKRFPGQTGGTVPPELAAVLDVRQFVSRTLSIGLSAATGFLGVLFQNLFICFAIHAAWNLASEWLDPSARRLERWFADRRYPH